MSFSKDELRELPGVISAPRFATYLRAAGNDLAKALVLYQWNLDISASLIIPLHICEVAIRNGMAEAIAMVHGENWPWSEGFLISLPVSKRARDYNPAKNLRSIAGQHRTAGKVIAELTFAFWECLFTKGQDDRLWKPYFHECFPGAPDELPISELRQTAHENLIKIRRLRNRIAHHEPIFSRNIAAEYERICEMIGWRSQVAAAWACRVQTTTALIAAKP